MNFDEYFLDIADVVRSKSKDPSSQIGAVIVGPDKQIISTGFNGFPRGIDEVDETRWERPVKYDYVEHAERNAIYNAARHGIALRGATMYMVGFGPPCTPCIACAKGVIQAGISTFVGRAVKPCPDSWKEELEFSRLLLVEAEVEVIEEQK
jgi:dCMP deaminase